jgi:VanZ family protein
VSVTTLQYKKLWLVIGYAMVVFVIFETLTPSPVGVPMNLSDKLLHVSGYFVLMAWFTQIYHRQYTRLGLLIAFVSMGVMLEFLQGWGGVRQFEVADMLANASGVMLAWLLSMTRFSKGLLWVDACIRS